MYTYDFHIHGRNETHDKKLISQLKKLGYTGTCITYTKDQYQQASQYLQKLKTPNFHLITGICIQTQNPNTMQKDLKKLYNKNKILFVQGGDTKINRIACENPKTDILSRPYYKNKNCGINHILAKEAKNNNVTIELTLSDILLSKGHIRSKIITYFQDIIKLQKKYKFPIIFTSSAKSIYDLRNPKDLILISQSIGLKNNTKDIFNNTPEKLINTNNEREKLIAKHVKLIKQ